MPRRGSLSIAGEPSPVTLPPVPVRLLTCSPSGRAELVKSRSTLSHGSLGQPVDELLLLQANGCLDSGTRGLSPWEVLHYPAPQYHLPQPPEAGDVLERVAL